MRRSTTVALAGWLLLFVFAFVAAPHSCEWGLSAYTWTGVALLIGLPIAAMFLPPDESGGRRALRVLGSAVATVVVWIAGLFIANVQIMCRLF